MTLEAAGRTWMEAIWLSESSWPQLSPYTHTHTHTPPTRTTQANLQSTGHKAHLLGSPGCWLQITSSLIYEYHAQQTPCKANLKIWPAPSTSELWTGQEAGDLWIKLKGSIAFSLAQLSLRSPRVPAFGVPAGRTPGWARMSHPLPEESLSFTQSWAVTSLGSLLTWLGAEPPARGEAAGPGSLDGGQESFCSGSAPCSLTEPSYPRRPLSPYLRGLSHLPTLPAEPSRSPGSLCDSRVPLSAPARWAPSQPPAAAVASRKAESGSPYSPRRRLRPGPGAISPGLVQGGSSVPPARKWKCASWIAAATTAVAGDEEKVATPAGEPERRAEARGSESRALTSLALRRAGGRAGGTAGTPRHGEAPRTHPPLGCPGPARARGAGCSWARASAASRLARCLLAASFLSSPDFTSPARAPRAAAAAAAAAASSASARRAPRTEAQHCLPLNSLHATWPSLSLPGSWADPVPGLLRSLGKGLSLPASVSSTGEWVGETHVLRSFGELTVPSCLALNKHSTNTVFTAAVATAPADVQDA